MNRKDFLFGLTASFYAIPKLIAQDSNVVPKELFFEDDGIVPNSKLPLLYYNNVFSSRYEEGAEWLEKKFYSNNWSNSWRNGIFTFQHYHSIAHEVLGIYSGQADVLLGGEEGEIVTVSAGDIIVIPAGVGHKNVGSEDLGVVGAYPNGMPVDIIRASKKERPKVDENIAKVPMPNQDPFQGAGKGLTDIW